ncbi:30S ribosomal protein S2 [Mycoplasma iguanae]|uniref:Small ribosomal subunit protein uS2 n=1 Tax=Mycoplasma iguanae TaxID=292461 RepID=A0ABY5RA50_9MOLU|nr:30S ribosomal protein S2 [Mycoplasma iguanae]UVD81495.1 30S ribosomal protein S2 [Mycoplasma iguanae]
MSQDLPQEKLDTVETSESKPTQNKEIVSKAKLLEAGTYFGHRVANWNPKMKPYIHTKKMGIHIIDIVKTQNAIEFAYKLVNKFAQKGASFIFVGTKKQAKKTVEEQALRTNSAYVSERWLGGTLTNSKTIFSSVRKMYDLERLAENNFEGYTKKEGVLMTKELAKLRRNLNGIKNMKQQPQVMIVADPLTDLIAVKEARKKGVKVVGILDSNADPSLVDLGIPANDDSSKSIALILTILADAIVAAKNGKQLFAYQPESEVILPDDGNKEQREQREQRRYNNPRTPYTKREFVNKETNKEQKTATEPTKN